MAKAGVGESGIVVLNSIEVSSEKVPEPVIRSFQTSYPAAAIQRIEQVFVEGKTHRFDFYFRRTGSATPAVTGIAQDGQIVFPANQAHLDN
jgi:hypothetical protein